MKRVAVIGGGVAGLSAAFHLEQHRRKGVELEYMLFEAGPRLGGVIRSELVDGFVIEAGPDSFLTEKPWAAQFCRYLGMADDLVPSNDYQRKTYILSRGRLVEIPDGLMFMVPTKLWPMATTPLFSLGAKLHAARELLLRPRPLDGDESVAHFVARHFGREMVERMADPLLAGVYGGSSDKLSVRAVLPRFVTMQEKTGSLARAMIAARKKMPANPGGALFTTLRHGMQSMTDAAAAQLKSEWIRLNAPVWSVRRAGDRWSVVTDAGDQHFDAVILALPANKTAELLGAVDPLLAQDLGGVSYTSSLTILLAFDATAIDAPTRARMEGFGFLVPTTEVLQIPDTKPDVPPRARSAAAKLMACTFVHNKFNGRAPEGKLLLRCFIGGETAATTMQLSDEEIVASARGQLRWILGLEGEPLFTRVFRWQQAMAQYEVGHLERIARVENRLQGLPGLALAGNAYHGIGVPDCIREGSEAAEKLLRR